MRALRNTSGFFEAPYGMVQLLLGVSVAVFALCTLQSGLASIPAEMLFRYGAMYSLAIDRHEYWRLVAYGFLHADPVHLIVNMLCLVLWGGLLEKRLGSLYFAFVYGSGLIVAAIVSNVTHHGAYLSVGASGAISAVLGALLCLRILGKIDLSWNFFAINIGLNVALAASSSRIDWGAHFGGFVAGMTCCACLDVIEKVNARLLRCKFPEFVKMNAFVAFAVAAGYYWTKFTAGLTHPEIWVLALTVAIVGLAVIKALDLVLSMKKGLAIVVITLALANTALVLLLRNVLVQALAPICAGQLSANTIAAIVARACADHDVTINLAAVAAFVLTILVYWRQFARGITDVGFVGATLRGERGRHQGV